MNCTLTVSDGKVIIADPSRTLIGKHHSQMAVWGFSYDSASRTYIRSAEDPEVLERVASYLTKFRIPVELTVAAVQLREKQADSALQLEQAMKSGSLLKAAVGAPSEHQGFVDYLKTLPRQLKDHQIKAALHVLSVGNGANFSVPGSGKTTVVLVAFGWLRSQGKLSSLFVVGPPSCFAPWLAEYEAVLGQRPSFEILAGGNINERLRKYYPQAGAICDIYLTSFQTLQRDWERAKQLIDHKDANFLLVVDEAHYIKQLDGAWAEAVLGIAPFAKLRCVLTGTPFPHSFLDAFNYFDVLWPGCSPISKRDRVRIAYAIQKKNDGEAAGLLSSRIDPLFYRVRKSDLGLAAQNFREPVSVAMKRYERQIYDSIVLKIRNAAKTDDYQEFELLTRLRRGRMMRLRQCLSYSRLLVTAVTDYNEDLLSGEPTLGDSIKHYDALERPAKLDAVVELVGELRAQGEKVVIWSNFVHSLKLIKSSLLAQGHKVELIFGETPTEASSETDEMSREKLIRAFVTVGGGVDVLVANPAACAESISLHKDCSHAVYYDLSYNCAQYLQSLDRIHRVGGSEQKVSHYHVLQYADTFDEDILKNLRRKAAGMSAVIDGDCPVYSLDMFSDEDEQAAYERLFRQRS